MMQSAGQGDAESVVVTQDLIRIARMRRRVWSADDAEWIAEEMTRGLRKPRGTMRLRPVQAISLYELGTIGGVFGPQTVGAGKTIPTILAPVVTHSQRPLLIVPASLVEKTKRDKEVLDQHFHTPHFLKIMSYEWLGRESAGTDVAAGKPDALTDWRPDLIILDEAHRLKNRDAAVTRRVTRYFRAFPKTRCAAFSGTFTKRSIHEYAHILAWCLPKDLLPIPVHWRDLELWALALDERKSQRFGEKRAHPGALEALCVDDADKAAWRQDPFEAARRVFRRRLVETPGVVATQEASVDATLVIRAKRVELDERVDEAFARLRQWETPDGELMADGLERTRHARELALGFWYKWDPAPPREWLEPRRAWHKFVRETLKHSRKLDSELQVRNWIASIERAVAEGKKHKLDEQEAKGVVTLRAWLAVRDSFRPNTVPVWFDSSALEVMVEWARTRAGIVWVEHQCVAQRLRDEFGLAYYGEQGLDARGNFIDHHDRRKSFAASIAANSEGRNLQAWCKNMVTSPPANGKTWQQLLGRTHRPGQESDEVECDVIVSCVEHVEAFDQSLRDARYVQASTGDPQKLLLATVDFHKRVFLGHGPRWEKETED